MVKPVSSDATTPIARRLIVMCGLAAALFLVLALWLALTLEPRAPVEGWMTPRLVILTQGLSEDDLLALLGPNAMAPSRTLNRIAAEAGRDPAALIAQIEAAALARR